MIRILTPFFNTCPTTNQCLSSARQSNSSHCKPLTTTSLNGKWKPNMNCSVLKLKCVHQKSQPIGVAAINTQHASHKMKQVQTDTWGHLQSPYIKKVLDLFLCSTKQCKLNEVKKRKRGRNKRKKQTKKYCSVFFTVRCNINTIQTNNMHLF